MSSTLHRWWHDRGWRQYYRARGGWLSLQGWIWLQPWKQDHFPFERDCATPKRLSKEKTMRCSYNSFFDGAQGQKRKQQRFGKRLDSFAFNSKLKTARLWMRPTFIVVIHLCKDVLAAKSKLARPSPKFASVKENSLRIGLGRTSSSYIFHANPRVPFSPPHSRGTKMSSQMGGERETVTLLSTTCLDMVSSIG